MKYVNLDFEPIHPHLRTCLEAELARLPGSRLIERRGRLIFQGLGGFEIDAQTLCAAKARWAELLRRASIMDSEKWDILMLLISAGMEAIRVATMSTVSRISQNSLAGFGCEFCA